VATSIRGREEQNLDKHGVHAARQERQHALVGPQAGAGRWMTCHFSFGRFYRCRAMHPARRKRA